MKNVVLSLKRCPLFVGMNEEEINSLIKCLNARELSVKKGQNILTVGDRPEYVGVVLEGSVYVTQDDYWGNRHILNTVQTGGLFAEAFSCADASSLPVSVIAQSNSEILLIDCKKILTTCSSSCMFHTRLIRNLMKVLANKNISLTKKMEYITKKSTKDRVLLYLSECAQREGTNSFSIPFNRQELADYLSVERSALSNTLSKMQDDGTISFDKNKFTIL